MHSQIASLLLAEGVMTDSCLVALCLAEVGLNKLSLFINHCHISICLPQRALGIYQYKEEAVVD